MEFIPEHPLLEFPPNILNNVRKSYELDKPGRMDQAIDILDLWVKKRNHFNKKDFPRDYLEKIIITTKGSMERAKMRMDKYCTLKSLIPSFFEKVDAKNDFGDLSEVIRTVVLPKQTPDYYRIYVMELPGKPFDDKYLLNFYRYSVILAEYMKVHDYCDGFIYICDYRNVNVMDLIQHMHITEMRQALAVFVDGFGMRIKGIHIITASKMVDSLVKLLKSVLSEKLGNRIHVHKDLTTLYEFIPQNILPSDLGGTEQSIGELQGKWLDLLASEKHISYMKEMQKASTNESLRQKDEFNDQYLGIPGSFRALSVD